MSIYAQNMGKLIETKKTENIAPGPYVPLVTSSVQDFVVPEIRSEEDCELLKQTLLKVPGIIDLTADLKTKKVRVVVDRFSVNMENVWKAILQSGIYPRAFEKFEN